MTFNERGLHLWNIFLNSISKHAYWSQFRNKGYLLCFVAENSTVFPIVITLFHLTHFTHDELIILFKIIPNLAAFRGRHDVHERTESTERSLRQTMGMESQWGYKPFFFHTDPLQLRWVSGQVCVSSFSCSVCVVTWLSDRRGQSRNETSERRVDLFYRS